jgi:threonine/homoserine/homoserine lactone efflux protein
MGIGQALGFVGATIVLVGMPGPNNIYISLRSLAQGRRAGVVSAIAIETGTLVYALVAALGLVARTAPAVFTAITLAGAAYLAVLGVKSLRAPATDGLGTARGAARADLSRRRTRESSQPEGRPVFLALLPQFTTRDAGPDLLRTEMLKLGAAVVVIALLLDLGYALGADALGRRAGRIGRSNSRISAMSSPASTSPSLWRQRSARFRAEPVAAPPARSGRRRPLGAIAARCRLASHALPADATGTGWRA